VTSDDFAWEVLADASADVQMLYEPLASARTLLPDTPEPERQRIVERTLRALHGAGLIVFVRGGDPPDTAFSDPERHLADDEVDEVLASPGWRTIPVGDDGTRVWLAATEAGRRTWAEQAPADVVERRAAENGDEGGDGDEGA
jgi:hypothetical protein